MSLGRTIGAFVDGWARADADAARATREDEEKGQEKGQEKGLPPLVRQPQPAGGEAKASSGAMSAGDVFNIAKAEVERQGLVGVVPKDGAKYGITTGSADEWGRLFLGLGAHESGLNNGTVGDADRFNGGSRGIWQLSYHDAPNYKLNDGKPFTPEQLADPRQNAAAAVTIAKTLIDKHGGIEPGMGRYWGPISKEGWTPGKGRDAGVLASLPTPQASAAAGPPGVAAPPASTERGIGPFPQRNPLRGTLPDEPADTTAGNAVTFSELLRQFQSMERRNGLG